MRIALRKLGVFPAVVAILALEACSGGTEMVREEEDPNMSPQQRLFVATAVGDVAAMEELLTADPSLLMARGIGGMTPLHSAAAAGQDEAVTYLLEHGADPTVMDESSNNAIGAALSEGHKETAQLIRDWLQNLGAGAANQ